ncbi:MAG: protoporphyrinogen oxidase HemJ [Tatlockia sp.]|jgi:putative membrane protein
MLVIKAFHIIAMVAWFAGLFYLPRLFVYHADAKDALSIERFKIMERRLYYGITWPAALITLSLGIMLVGYNPQYYLKAAWFHAKLGMVFFLLAYHVACGHYLKQFALNKNKKKALFFRVVNEVPTLLLIGIVLLVVMKPF